MDRVFLIFTGVDNSSSDPDEDWLDNRRFCTAFFLLFMGSGPLLRSLCSSASDNFALASVYVAEKDNLN